MEKGMPLLFLFFIIDLQEVIGMSNEDKLFYRDKTLEMFRHGFNSYMDYAYPADELMPLSCRGRVRGRETSRGDIDETLGHYSLTLVDSLDTLAVLGEIDDFVTAIKIVIQSVTFDADLVISVFEANIRVLGGLLGAHFAAQKLKEQGEKRLKWYKDELVWKADELGQRLLPAFNTTTGLPYARINLNTGNFTNGGKAGWDTTCTACAGTLLMEFAALSRLTGNPIYEEKAHRAMEVIWEKRNEDHNLVGTIINVNTGEWIRRDSGVGAGSDSYYEYCLKSYIVLGDEVYLERFQKHYNAIMMYIANGPFLIDCDMHKPRSSRKSSIDSLLAFWPGLQVLWGDIDVAASIHDVLYYVNHKHDFLPEAINIDLIRVLWGSHPLRPEFAESTYFLYKATGDTYYLDIGKSIVESLDKYARVKCGFAAMKDVRTKAHEDRMDSFVLAETFKYLYLLFAEENHLPFDLDDFVFTTEAHLIPISLQDMDNGDRREGDIVEDKEKTQLVCPPFKHRMASLNQYERMMKKQTSSPRFWPASQPKPKPKIDVNPLSHHFPTGIDFNKESHLNLLHKMGIFIEAQNERGVIIKFDPEQAKTGQLKTDGILIMQHFSTLENNKKGNRVARTINLLSPTEYGFEPVLAGPAQFGPDFSPEAALEGPLAVAHPFDLCQSIRSDKVDIVKHIVLIQRGGCSFMTKVRNAQEGGAKGAIIIDNTQSKDERSGIFSMAPDGNKDDIRIHSVFVTQSTGTKFLQMVLLAQSRSEKVEVQIQSMINHPDLEQTLEQTQEVGSSEQTQEVGSSEQAQEVGSSEQAQEVGSSEQTQEVGSLEQTKEP